MEKFLAALVCLFITFAAFSEGERESETSGGSGVRQFTYTGFTVVETGYGIDVKIVQSQSYSVALFADPQIIDRIEIESAGRTLKIGMRWGFPMFRLPWKGRARVEIGMPSLEGLGASGGSHLDVNMDAGTGSIFARLSGGSSCAGNIRCGDLEITASGGSSAELVGDCRLLRVNGSGGSVYRLAGLSVRELDAQLSGGSSAETSVSETVSLRASGGSHVVYHGEALVGRQSLSGGSWIRRD
jgi:hypothetical protein